VLGDLETFAKSAGDTAAMSSVKETRASLERLIGKMDGIESGFDRIAERSRELGNPTTSIQLLIKRSLRSVVCFLAGIAPETMYVVSIPRGRWSSC
jgi:hypothetical protein